MFGRSGPRSGKGDYTFSEGSRRALHQARSEAQRLGHSSVGTEHMLLAIVSEPDDEAVRVLESLGLAQRRLQRDIEGVIGSGPSRPSRGELPYTSRAKKALELAMSEARDLNHQAVSTGHLVLGLMREEKGVAAQVLRQHVMSLAIARAAVVRVIENPTERFAIAIDESSDRSIYEQIVAQVREGVATGKLTPSERLQTVRELADELDIAPGTVARAYGELERLGVVITDGARGTRVAPRERPAMADAQRPETLLGLLRPVAVAAFHLGASAGELRDALEQAMRDIFGKGSPSSA
jgi:DNA-binding transcriptional regulator YhcF (GntR family)